MRLERAAAAAHSHHLDGVFPHHKQAPGAGLQGQHAALVLQEHDTLLGNRAGCIVVGLAAQEAVAALAGHGGAVVQAQHATHLVVELAGGVLAAHDAGAVGHGHVIHVVGVLGPGAQAVGPRAKLHVETVFHSLVGIVSAAPVAHHHAVVVPLALEQVDEQVAVVAVVLVAVEVVGAHQAPGVTALDGGLKGRQVDLAQGAVAHGHVHLEAVFLVVVQGKVLHAGSHAVALQPLNVGHHHGRGQAGILAHVLKVAAAQRRAAHVHARAQYHVLAAVQGLLAQAAAIEPGHRRVPRSGQAGESREGHTRVVGVASLLPLVPQHVGAHPVRAVVGPEVGQAQALHPRSRKLALRVYHGNLLVEGHAAQGIVDALFHRLPLVEIHR